MAEEFCTFTDGYTVSFVEQKDWSCLGSEQEARQLKTYMIYNSVITNNGIYLIMEEINQGKDVGEELHKIARFAVNDETGRVELNTMTVTAEQARTFAQSRDLWE